MGNHFLLIEASHALPEDVVLLSEDAPGPDVHHGLGTGGFWTGRGDGLLRRPTVLQPGRMAEMIPDTSHENLPILDSLAQIHTICHILLVNNNTGIWITLD